MKPSIHQSKIYSFIQKESGSLLIKATAGSGKTTTILECLKLIPSHKSSIFVSFSNTIVKELKQRVPSHVQASTLHSLGLSILRKKYPKLKVTQNKYFSNIAEKLFDIECTKDEKEKRTKKEIYTQVYQIIEVINAIKLTVTPLIQEEVLQMGLFYGLDVCQDNIDISINILKKERWDGNVDFTDMLYQVLVQDNLYFKKYDYIFYDEVQDANKAQLLLVEKLLKPDGRLIMVGDWHQAIYGFSYSDIKSLSYLENRKNTTILPLSVCYRCDKNIVREAQKVNNEIEFFENKEEGIVRRGNLSEIEQGDILVCRNTKPIIHAYLTLLEQKKHVSIVGKEYRDQLKRYLKKFTLDGIIKDREIIYENIDKYLNTVISQLLEVGVQKPKESNKYLQEEEITSIFKILIQQWGVLNLEQEIDKMYSEGVDSIKLMTIHKSKGLENDRVFFLDIFEHTKLIPSKYAIKDWELKQEQNLQFVAITRAKHELIYCSL